MGYISSCNETDYIFQSISPRGLYDGFLLRKTNRIFKLDFNGSYEKKIQTLSKFNNVQHCKFDFGKENLVNAMLKFAILVSSLALYLRKKMNIPIQKGKTYVIKIVYLL